MIRILIVVAFICAVVGVISALIPKDILTMGPDGWIVASLVAFYLDLLVGSPTVGTKGTP